MGKNHETSCKNNVKYQLMANKEIKDFLFLHQYMPKMASGNKVYKTIDRIITK